MGISQGGLTDEQKISIFETQANTYRCLQTALIAQNKTNKALEVSEGGRARALIELLSSKFNPNQLPNIKPPNIEPIKQIAQQQKATFVEYSVIDESQLYIWVISLILDLLVPSLRLGILNLQSRWKAEPSRNALQG